MTGLADVDGFKICIQVCGVTGLSTTDNCLELYMLISVMSCPEPSDVKNAHKIPARGPYRCGGHVTYLCNHGYTLQGDPTRRCQDNGTFSRRQAVCVEDDNVGGALR